MLPLPNEGTTAGKPAAIFLVETLVSAIAILISILQDLNNMSHGEETISFEPHETIFDVIGTPRFYRKRDIKAGRVSLPEDKSIKYRLVD